MAERESIIEDGQEERRDAPEAARPDAARLAAPGGAFEVRIVPDELAIELRPAPGSERYASLWHPVRPRPGVLVSLTSLGDDDTPRRVSLSVESDTPGWRAPWVRWSFAVRTVSELLGGDAVSAQDVLSPDQRTLTLLLLPGERREATLEIEADLDGQTRPGDYLFEIVAEEMGEGGGVDTTVGRLRLRHPEPGLMAYLPAIYREARCPCDAEVDGFPDLPFFQRFLLGFEDALTPMSALLDRMDRFFGANTAPPPLQAREESSPPGSAGSAGALLPRTGGNGATAPGQTPPHFPDHTPLRTSRDGETAGRRDGLPVLSSDALKSEAARPSRPETAAPGQPFTLEQPPASPDFLSWLATWVALVTDENWPELKRRRLIREAADLYRWRGTRRGLSRYLEIYAGVIPEINDQPFAGMRLGTDTLLGRDTLLGDVPPHTFVVTLALPDPETINEQVVRDIIDSEKPAHTGYALRIVGRAAGAEERERA